MHEIFIECLFGAPLSCSYAFRGGCAFGGCAFAFGRRAFAFGRFTLADSRCGGLPGRPTGFPRLLPGRFFGLLSVYVRHEK